MSDGRAASDLRSVLGPYVLEDADAPPNYSVRLASRSQDFHVLYRGECPVLRTMDVTRLVNALQPHLGAHGDVAPGLLRFDAHGVVHEGTVTLVPEGLRERLDRVDRRLQRAGVFRIDVPHVDIDPSRLEVVVDSELDLSPLAHDLTQRFGARSTSERFTRVGRFPISRWLSVSHPLVVGQPTRATSLFQAWSSLLVDGAVDPARLLDDLERASSTMVSMLGDTVDDIALLSVLTDGRGATS